MIGVIANEIDKEAAKEFFQLFKTPWEFYKKNRKYDVVITATDKLLLIEADLIIFYSSRLTQFDLKEKLEPEVISGNIILQHSDLYFPIYGQGLTFRKQERTRLISECSGNPLAIEIEKHDKKIVRIGYDLFFEISVLLSKGQPVEFAKIPTIECHIAILRNTILNAGKYLIEIPATPHGYNFVVCLTHDVDFAGIRNHRFDHTFFGFLYRAVFGSIIEILKRRMPLINLFRNWYSVLLSVGIFCGLARDYWDNFKSYLELEDFLPSTFFVIPVKNYAGKMEKGRAPKSRAVKYDIFDIQDRIKLLIDNGCEIGLHGIDAWIDENQGRKEFETIKEVTNRRDIGIRMHWLYFNEKSPQRLVKANFLYDSTLGFNETIGFRNGTTQIFCILGSGGMPELPMNIMDTALFYPARMNLTDDQAWSEVQKIVISMARHGGVLTINWHNRSIAPERLWDNFYTRLLKRLRQKKVWFAKASQAVYWFKKRREIEFSKTIITDNALSVNLKLPKDDSGPNLSLRIYLPHTSGFVNKQNEYSTHNYKELDIRDEQIDIKYDQLLENA